MSGRNHPQCNQRTIQLPPVFPEVSAMGQCAAGLTRKQTELASKLLFDSPVLLSMEGHTHVQKISVHHLVTDDWIRRVKDWVCRLFHHVFGRNIVMSEISGDGSSFGIYLTDEDLEGIYQYSMRFRSIRTQGGVTSDWMSPWTVFSLEKDERTISVMTPNQVDFLDLCHKFPNLAAGPDAGGRSKVPNMICSMGPALAARAFEIMNTSYEEDWESGTISWGKSVQRYVIVFH